MPHFDSSLLSTLSLHLRHTSSDRELARYPPPFQKVWVSEGNSGARCVPPFFTLAGCAHYSGKSLSLIDNRHSLRKRCSQNGVCPLRPMPL